jgi:hypothetical protein
MKLRSLIPDFDKLELSDRLGQQSSTKPRYRNPLMEVVHKLREAIASFDRGVPALPVGALTEVDALLSFLDR